MTQHKHTDHDHVHGDCEHTAVRHEDHVDHLHDGHLHATADGPVAEHTIAVNRTNPSDCTPEHRCDDHAEAHAHGGDCGHEAVPHGDHSDYLVGAHLHHPHAEHCDDHGPLLPA